MELPRVLSFLFFALFALSAEVAGVPFVKFGKERRFIGGEKNSEPWEKGLSQFDLLNGATQSVALELKYELVLSAKRTKRPDILNDFQRYREGWDITNRHYWASVGFTGAAGFILSALWFICFAVVLVLHRCCGWGINIMGGKSHLFWRIFLFLLLLFTCAAAIGCILLSVGQSRYHGDVSRTLDFVVSQSDLTVQILKNVTGYLSLAKNINVDQFILSSEDQAKIDKLNVDLDKAANVLSEKTYENSVHIKKALDAVRSALICIAAIMLLLAIIGFGLTLLAHQHAIYIFILSGWLLVAVTFILCGVFVILENVVSDTCLAMDEWVDHPQAESALSNILPCVDERTTNQTLYQSKEVISELVDVVNTAIYTVANSNSPQSSASYFYNQSGPLMPSLCNPFDSQLSDRQCQEPWEVSLSSAPTVWKNYTCEVSASGLCVTRGRVTPELYSQLVAAANVSYALYYYTPFLLSLQDCNFVRSTFTTITSSYCSPLGNDLKMVNVGLALISVGVMLCLILWVLHSNRPQDSEKTFAQQVPVGEKPISVHFCRKCGPKFALWNCTCSY